MAQDRAHKAGVDAEIMVRQGIFREALAEVIAEKGVETVVIGKSSEGVGVTNERYLAILANTVREKGVEMLVVKEGELVRRYAANDDNLHLPPIRGILLSAQITCKGPKILVYHELTAIF